MINWGCNIGWMAISGSQLRMKNESLENNYINETLILTNEEISWLGASFSIGGLCGALSAGKNQLCLLILLVMLSIAQYRIC